MNDSWDETFVVTVVKWDGLQVLSVKLLNSFIYYNQIEPTDINPAPLTHIVYSFADVSADTGTISLTDSYADEQVTFFSYHFPVLEMNLTEVQLETLPWWLVGRTWKQLVWVPEAGIIFFPNRGVS